ncbi:MAG: signal peptidase I, partial [Bacteroidota bacterium]
RERLDEIVPYNQVLPDLEERGAATDYSYLHDQHSIFPNIPEYDWTRDNFGPIDIPQRGASVELTLQNLPIYERVITIYEGHELEVREGKIFIDGAETSSYTFAMDYYWLMGDNRHNSADSRFWGFVPEDHVVGKAVFVWLSLDPEKGLFDGKIRWDRMFRSVK